VHRFFCLLELIVSGAYGGKDKFPPFFVVVEIKCMAESVKKKRKKSQFHKLEFFYFSFNFNVYS